MAPVAPLIVITGPTGSGKSSIALSLAEHWDGEIICADSRTIYTGMDIGTAKPTLAEQQRVPHWGLGVVEPGMRFTAADFKQLATSAIDDIRSRGKIPFLVGGTGLYVDAVVLDFTFGPDADQSERSKLNSMTVEQLQELIYIQHIDLPENSYNKRHLIRCIEKNNIATSDNVCPNADSFVFAIQTSKDVLQERMRMRIDEMFRQGVVQETQRLLAMYGPENEAMTGNIYRIVQDFLAGDIGEVEARAQCAIRDRQLAKRQLTWLKRHPYVRWVSLEQAEIQIESILRKYRDA